MRSGEGLGSTPEVLKRQHLYGLLIAGKAPANAGRKSVTGRRLVSGKAGKGTVPCGGVKLCRMRCRLVKEVGFVYGQRHSAGVGVGVILQTALMCGKIRVQRSFARWSGLVARVARLTSALVRNA